MTRSTNFRQADLTRAVKAMRAAGVAVGQVTVDPVTGRITITPKDAAPAASAHEWDGYQ